MATRREVPRGVVHARRAGLLMLVGLAAAYLQLPYSLLAVAPLLYSAYESVRAIMLLQAEHAPRRLVVWASVGLALCGLLTLSTLLPYAFYPIAKAQQDCLLGANTNAARAECRRVHNVVEPLIRNSGMFSG